MTNKSFTGSTLIETLDVRLSFMSAVPQLSFLSRLEKAVISGYLAGEKEEKTNGTVITLPLQFKK